MSKSRSSVQALIDVGSRMLKVNAHDFTKNRRQLALCEPGGRIWIDAGAGRGAYSRPLASLVEHVIAVERDPSALEELRRGSAQYPNIAPLFGDFYTDRLSTDPVDGFLFAFSLHYAPNPERAFANALAHMRGANAQILVIDYCVRLPRPWVPRPLPPDLALEALQATGRSARIVFQNERFYIAKGQISPPP